MAERKRAEVVRWPEDTAGQRKLIQRAADLIRAGEVVAFPTDTVYGIGVHAWNHAAIQRLYAVKERPATKAIALLISGHDQVRAVSDYSSADLGRLATRFWPGGLTLILPWKPQAQSAAQQPFATVGLRMPDHPIALALIAEVGVPLATTSANLSGAPSAVTAGEVDRQIGDRVAMIIDGGTCPGGRDSTVVDLTTRPPVVRRLGAVSVEELESVLGTVAVET
ncbi:MAG TPA: L-threonylcarbamoyladenylate synthase [Chloroflexota bacterium]|nr:L-threonylcarbamoyladenylate synthase [Chloroflexota bacterium]